MLMFLVVYEVLLLFFTAFDCTDKPEGQYVNPNNCTTFIVCSHGILTEIPCAAGLYYDDVAQVCNWWYNLSDERQAECGVVRNWPDKNWPDWERPDNNLPDNNNLPVGH